VRILITGGAGFIGANVAVMLAEGTTRRHGPPVERADMGTAI